jgi:hypothetical protein
VKKLEGRDTVITTVSSHKPAGFPLGTLESRAAARAMAIMRAAQRTKAPTIYRAPRFRPGWQPGDDEPFEIYDYGTGLPINSESKADKPLPPEATQTSSDARETEIIITIES